MWGAFSRKKRIFTSEKEFNSLELKHQEKVFIFLIGNELNWLQFHSLHALLSHRKEVHKNVNYLNYCIHICCLLNQCNFNYIYIFQIVSHNKSASHYFVATVKNICHRLPRRLSSSRDTASCH